MVKHHWLMGIETRVIEIHLIGGYWIRVTDYWNRPNLKVNM
jgi:hypothetical protein